MATAAIEVPQRLADALEPLDDPLEVDTYAFHELVLWKIRRGPLGQRPQGIVGIGEPLRHFYRHGSPSGHRLRLSARPVKPPPDVVLKDVLCRPEGPLGDTLRRLKRVLHAR